MGRRITTTVTALVALLATLLAAPSAAQTPEEECLVALQAQVQPFTAEQLEALGDYFDDPGSVSLEAFLRDLLDDPTLSLAGLDPNVCTIYITNVFSDDDDDGDADDDGVISDDDGRVDDDGVISDDDGRVDDDGGSVDDDGSFADDGERVPPPPQRRRLPFTGFDVLWLTGLGVAIIGLGYVAVRRSRDQAH
jgi:hypothetical protein